MLASNLPEQFPGFNARVAELFCGLNGEFVYGLFAACWAHNDLFGVCTGAKFVVQGAGEAYDARMSGPNRKF